MLTLDEMKKLQEDRAGSRVLEPYEVPVGMTVLSDDGKNKAQIVSVCNGTVFLGGPVIVGGVESLQMTVEEMKNNWLFELPNGNQIPCCVPDDSGIVTPSQAANQGFTKIEV